MLIDKSYRKFENNVRRCIDTISCPECEEKMDPQSYGDHCETRHGLDSLVCCVFCLGRVTWPRGQKTQNGPHLSACFSSFVNRYRVQHEIAPPSESPLPPYCSERCFEFRSATDVTLSTVRWSDFDWNDAGVSLISEPLFESNAERLDFTESDVWRNYESDRGPDKKRWLALLNPLKFDASSGLDGSDVWMKRYMYTSWTTDNARHYTWYHLCVRAGYIQSFVEAMRESDIVAVDRWCVCDGGIDDPAQQGRKHHRHLIVAVKNCTRFSNDLKRLEYRASGEVPGSTSKRYYSRPIKTANHFAATLVYVSRPRSQCHCKKFLEEDEPADDSSFLDIMTTNDTTLSSRDRHYFIRKTMVSHAMYWLMLLVPCDGIDHLARFITGSRKILGMNSRRRVGNRWMLCASEELNVKNCVVRFDPSNLQIDGEHCIKNLKTYVEKKPFVYWFNGKTFPVKLGDDLPMDRNFQEWHVSTRQNTLLNLGNVESWFFMSHKQACNANELAQTEKMCMERKEARHLVEVNELKTSLDRMQIEINRLRNGPYETLKKQLEKIEKERDKYKKQVDVLTREKIKDLKKEISELKKELKRERNAHEKIKKKYTPNAGCRKRKRAN